MIKCNTGESCNTYNEYLSSRHWKKVRLDCYSRTNGKCAVCGCDLDPNFIGHHKTYKRIGHEAPKDVISVCQTCHNPALHKNVDTPIFAQRGNGDTPISQLLRKNKNEKGEVKKMKPLRSLISLILIIGAFIGGIAITRWGLVRGFTNKVGLTEPQTVIVQEIIDYDMVVEYADDGEIIIKLRKKD